MIKKTECRTLATKISLGTYLLGRMVNRKKYQKSNTISTILSKFKMAFNLFFIFCPPPADKAATTPAKLARKSTVNGTTAKYRIIPFSDLSETSKRCMSRHMSIKKINARLPFPTVAINFNRPCESLKLASCSSDM